MSIQNNVIGPFSAQGVSDPYGALANFEVGKVLGHGHFSVVFSARNRFTGVAVALKKVHVRLLLKRIKTLYLPIFS
jgi:serine/threonine protein kinase